MKITKSQMRALKLMADARPDKACAQEGVIDKYGRVVCYGEHRGISPATWLRLVTMGFVTGSDGRLRLTTSGAVAADSPG